MLRKWPGLPSRMPRSPPFTRISNVEGSETRGALCCECVASQPQRCLSCNEAQPRSVTLHSGLVPWPSITHVSPRPVACTLYYLSATSR